MKALRDILGTVKRQERLLKESLHTFACTGVSSGVSSKDLKENRSRQGVNTSPAPPFESAFRRRADALFGKGGLKRVAVTLAMTLITVAGYGYADAATPVGTAIDNAVNATYKIGSSTKNVTSNTVTTTVVVLNTASSIAIYKYTPGLAGSTPKDVNTTEYRDPGGTFIPSPAPSPFGGGAPVDLGLPVPLTQASLFHGGEPVFIELTDYDENTDPATAETLEITLSVSVTGDAEVLRLAETGPDTGVFVGYVETVSSPGSAPNSGTLEVTVEAQILVTYTDPSDGTDNFSAAVLVDPFGIVFNSITGDPIDGATVTLIDVLTGLPATVFGDDGISVYPSTVTTGGTATDVGGTVYNFPSGGYRFPFIVPGTYRFDITMPAGFIVPSVVATAALQALPGAPFAIALPGSRGEDFIVTPGPALHIDIPADPLLTSLHVIKTASTNVAAIGDFLRYTLKVENFSGAPMPGVVLTDVLPLGMRYEEGSVRLGGIATTEPSVSNDGRTLVFNAGTVDAATTIEITYVVSVTAGARLGTAYNIAYANGGPVTSNVARAGVRIKEDLVRSKSIIFGRVIEGDCGALKDETRGLKGVRLYLEDGTYVVTDAGGKYHVEGIRPGTHVLQLDTVTIPDTHEVVACEANTRNAGRPYSRFIELQGGTLWRADFYVRLKEAKKGSLALKLRSSLEGDIVSYTLPVTIGNLTVRKMAVTVMLPDELTYMPGSSARDGKALEEPTIMDNVLIYRLGDGKHGTYTRVTLKARARTPEKIESYITAALATFDTPSQERQSTSFAENILKVEVDIDKEEHPGFTVRPHFPPLGVSLNEADKAEIDKVLLELSEMEVSSLHVTGHTSSVGIREENKRFYKNNYVLSYARAESVATYLAESLGIPAWNVYVDGAGPDKPVASNWSDEGRALNRRVEVRVGALRLHKRYYVAIDKEDSGTKLVTTSGLRGGFVWDKPGQEEVEQVARKIDTGLTRANLPEDAEPGFEWFYPPKEFYPPISVYSPSVKHDPGTRIKLFHDGTEVNPLNYDGYARNAKSTVMVSYWRGVPIHEGDNEFVAIAIDPDGNELSKLKRVVHYSSSPVMTEFMVDRSTLVADGHTPPVIAIRLTDKDEYPAREGLVGEYSIEAPYMARKRAREIDRAPLGGVEGELTRYSVGPDGTIYLELEPTTVSGEAVVHLNLSDGAHEIRAYLEPKGRDWILVGLGEGTLAYNTISGNMEAALETGNEDNFYEDGRVAFFAKGRIKGEWLLTAAYDSEGGSELRRKELNQVIDPGTYYTLYGDGTAQGYEASSTERLYIKIERRQFYALFGDFSTGMTVTELSRYNRSMTGFKAEGHGKHYGFKAYASETHHAFVRDELRGDGTSGLYLLSRSDIVMNSEKVLIEVRDRFRSEKVVSRRTLTRHIDYDIDYDASTLYFREPVAARDEFLNPVYIAVEYESYDETDSSYNYGGRGALKVLGGRGELGATYVHEGRVGGEGRLYGVDAVARVTDYITVKAEAARTETDFAGVEDSGRAYVVSVDQDTRDFDWSVYAREEGRGFGLGQQSGTGSDTRKVGADATYHLTEKISTNATAFKHYNLTTDAVRGVYEGRLNYREARYTLYTGLRHARDEFKGANDMTSNQLMLGGTLRVFNGRLGLNLSHEQSIAKNENTAFPTRTTLGADLRLGDRITLFALHEMTYGETTDTRTTRLGVKGSVWSGSEVTSSIGRQFSENGERIYSNMGLRQSWRLTDKLSVDGGLERSDTISDDTRRHFNVNNAKASGETVDFTAVTIGSTYRQEKWALTGRGELRDSEVDLKRNLTLGIIGEVKDGLALSLSLRGMAKDAVSKDVSDTRELNVRGALALRKANSPWTILDRMDYYFEEEFGGALKLEGRRFVNNLNLNYKPSGKLQLGLQYGAKYVLATIDDNGEYKGYIDLFGLEGRYDLTKKWDVGVRVGMLRSATRGVKEFGTGMSLGHSFAENIWMSLGYNFSGFSDRDFSGADYTASGPFLKFRVKIDQKSASDLAKWLGGL